MIYKNIIRIYYLIFFSIVIVFIYMYSTTYSIKSKLNESIYGLQLQMVKELSQNVSTKIYNITNKKSLPDIIHKFPNFKRETDSALSMISTKYFAYVYILYRDKKGVYRFLADGSIGEKGVLDQPLNVNKKEWDIVYKSKKDNIIYQKKLDSLWTTYLHPILYKNRVVAVMAVDFSSKLPKKVKDMLAPLNKSFLFVFISAIVLILLFLMQLYNNYKIRKESYIDTLTNTYNRHYLRKFLKDINMINYQILMFDIDFFKAVNDTFGHQAGDLVLKEIAQLIKFSTRPQDIFFRFGGEEFLLFIKADGDINLALDIAKRIKDIIEEKEFNYKNNIIKTTISIGINLYPSKSKSIDKAIKYADKMLYAAKKDGRNCIRYIDKNSASTNKKLSAQEVKDAIEEERVICYYQPIFNTDTLKVVRHEALVRIIKDKKVITPFFFLEEIFNTTLYTNLTNIVIEHVFKKIKEEEVQISINLNFSDIANTKNYDLIMDKLKKYSAYAGYLTIELLEYEKIENLEIIQKRIKNIKTYGVKIALDDFGSGFANYEIFKYISIDIIKIDGSIIKDLPNSIVSQKAIKSIILFAKELNIIVVGEFIHSKAVFDKAKLLKITNLQGFYLSEPIADLLHQPMLNITN